MQLFIINAPPFRYRAFSQEKIPFCKVLLLILSKKPQQKQENKQTKKLELEKASILSEEKACDG